MDTVQQAKPETPSKTVDRFSSRSVGSRFDSSDPRGEPIAMDRVAWFTPQPVPEKLSLSGWVPSSNG